MELELANVQSEMLVVGSFFKNPELYLTYSQSVVPQYDFSDKACEFFPIVLISWIFSLP